jgi:rubrerythrin
MGRFIESRTAKNLLISYSAEAQARTRYNFFARRAEEEGFIQIGRLFDQTAEQEYEHALRFFKFFNGGQLEISWPFPAGVIEDTRSNLISSAALELHVSDVMYKGFSKIAVEEGFQRAADTFDAIIVAEQHHEKMFLELAENIDSGRVFSRQEKNVWRCLGCGYIHHGEEAPDKCPACVKPQGYFELLAHNW